MKIKIKKCNVIMSTFCVRRLISQILFYFLIALLNFTCEWNAMCALNEMFHGFFFFSIECLLRQKIVFFFYNAECVQIH